MKSRILGFVLLSLFSVNFAQSYTKKDLQKYKKISSILTASSNLGYMLLPIPYEVKLFVPDVCGLPEKSLAYALDENVTKFSSLSEIVLAAFCASDSFWEALKEHKLLGSAKTYSAPVFPLIKAVSEKFLNNYLVKKFPGEELRKKRAIFRIVFNSIIDFVTEVLKWSSFNDSDKSISDTFVQNLKSTGGRIFVGKAVASNVLAEVFGAFIAKGIEKSPDANLA